MTKRLPCHFPVWLGSQAPDQSDDLAGKSLRLGDALMGVRTLCGRNRAHCAIDTEGGLNDSSTRPRSTKRRRGQMLLREEAAITKEGKEGGKREGRGKGSACTAASLLRCRGDKWARGPVCTSRPCHSQFCNLPNFICVRHKLGWFTHTSLSTLHFCFPPPYTR